MFFIRTNGHGACISLSVEKNEGFMPPWLGDWVLENMGLALALFIGIIFSIGALAGWWIASYFLKRKYIRRLEALTERMEEGDRHLLEPIIEDFQ